MTTAAQLVALVTRIVGAEPPVRVRAWDGSEAGPVGAPVVVLRRLLWDPDELGLARAFVSRDLDVEGTSPTA